MIGNWWWDILKASGKMRSIEDSLPYLKLSNPKSQRRTRINKPLTNKVLGLVRFDGATVVKVLGIANDDIVWRRRGQDVDRDLLCSGGWAQAVSFLRVSLRPSVVRVMT